MAARRRRPASPPMCRDQRPAMAQAADWPRLAEAWGSLGHDLALRGGSLRSASWPKPGCHLVSTLTRHLVDDSLEREAERRAAGDEDVLVVRARGEARRVVLERREAVLLRPRLRAVLVKHAAPHRHTELRVRGELVEHVVEEADAAADLAGRRQVEHARLSEHRARPALGERDRGHLWDERLARRGRDHPAAGCSQRTEIEGTAGEWSAISLRCPHSLISALRRNARCAPVHRRGVSGVRGGLARAVHRAAPRLAAAAAPPRLAPRRRGGQAGAAKRCGLHA